MESLPNKSQAEKDKRYHKKRCKSYGLKIPQVKKVFQQYKHQMKELPIYDRFLLAELFYKSGYAQQGKIGNAIHDLKGNDRQQVLDVK